MNSVPPFTVSLYLRDCSPKGRWRRSTMSSAYRRNVFPAKGHWAGQAACAVLALLLAACGGAGGTGSSSASGAPASPSGSATPTSDFSLVSAPIARLILGADGLPDPVTPLVNPASVVSFHPQSGAMLPGFPAPFGQGHDLHELAPIDFAQLNDPLTPSIPLVPATAPSCSLLAGPSQHRPSKKPVPSRSSTPSQSPKTLSH
ncbi:MAG: hypothetical protein ACI9EF_002792 [Pseudohongiellaceae bacterium]|jgi:hypothetical protein